MDYYKRALELNDETIKNRRYFHTNAETGLHMPKACAYVMDKLKDLEAVAYVRFASVYREFKDVNTFMSELKKMLDK